MSSVHSVLTYLDALLKNSPASNKTCSGRILRFMRNLSVSLFGLQGMNFIAGYLLLITKDEETSFWLMDALLGRILPGVYVYVCTLFCHCCGLGTVVFVSVRTSSNPQEVTQSLSVLKTDSVFSLVSCTHLKNELLRKTEQN